MRDDKQYLGYGFCASCGRKIGYRLFECERCDELENTKYELLDELRLQNRRRKNARLKSGYWGEEWLTKSLVAALTQGATKNDWSLGKTEGKGVWKKSRYDYGGPHPADDVSQLLALLTEKKPAKKHRQKEEAK